MTIKDTSPYSPPVVACLVGTPSYAGNGELAVVCRLVSDTAFQVWTYYEKVGGGPPEEMPVSELGEFLAKHLADPNGFFSAADVPDYVPPVTWDDVAEDLDADKADLLDGMDDFRGMNPKGAN
jgi:hypothetical protein